MMRMLGIEIRRCFARRLVRWLIVLAVLGCLVTAFIAHRTASQRRPRSTRSGWPSCTSRAATRSSASAAFFLLIGAVVGGASMIGAEWRAGTFVTLLTWEPDRRRVAIAKLVACGWSPPLIAIVLLVAVLRAFLPAALGPGTIGRHRRRLVALGGGRGPAGRGHDGAGGHVHGVGGDDRPQHGRRARGGVRLHDGLREPRASLEAVDGPVPPRRERRDVRDRRRPRDRRFSRSTTTAGLTLPATRRPGRASPW